MKLTRIGLLCARGFCLLALAGCAVGPDFRKPEADVPPRWHGIEESGSFQETVQSVSTPVDLSEWWKSFDDPAMVSLIERAIRANPDLRQAQARIRQARAVEGVASAGLWPVVNADAAHNQSFASSVSRNLFRIGLDASWEVDIFGGTRRNIEAARADLAAAVEDRRDVLLTLVSDVAINYANLRQFQQQIEIARKNLEVQHHTAEITRKRHEAGFVGGLDVANATAQAATTESQIPFLEAQAKAAIYNLSILIGKEPTALEEELSLERPMPPTPPAIPIGLPSDLLRRRPDIRRAEAQVHAATARIGVATADLFPRFSLTGNFGTTGDDLLSLGNMANRFWSWGPTITWPIFSAGRIRWNIEVQNAVQEQVLLTYERAILTALNDVETALIAYSKELQRKELLAVALANNRKAEKLAMQLYVAGRTDFLNVLNAQRSLFASEEALAQSTNALITNLIALYKALGGGWEKTEGAGAAKPPSDSRSIP